jgi:four helix bundle protein
MSIRSYQDLRVRERAMDLVVESWRVANLLPKNEAYGPVTQIQRAAASVPANIAAGHDRDHLGDYLHHLSIAKGSLLGLETHILLAGRLNYPQAAHVDRILGMTREVGSMLAGMIRTLKKKN